MSKDLGKWFVIAIAVTSLTTFGCDEPEEDVSAPPEFGINEKLFPFIRIVEHYFRSFIGIQFIITNTQTHHGAGIQPCLQGILTRVIQDARSMGNCSSLMTLTI